MRFMEATAISLHAPQPYIEGVMNAPTMLPPPMEVVE